MTTRYNHGPQALLMIRPCAFGFNPQTAGSNAFQRNALPASEVQRRALEEFDAYAQLLEDHHIPLLIVEDTPSPTTPDSIFPNNWISFHQLQHNGQCVPGAVLYPMFAPNRREERKETVLSAIAANFPRQTWLDLTWHEEENLFLEGTGSIIFDHPHRMAYACRSPRTSEKVLQELCDFLAYNYLLFDSRDKLGKEIYHTNVMMCMGTEFAVVCLESIRDERERETLTKRLEQDGKEIVSISLEQVGHFAGNMLCTCGHLIMSAQAKASLTPQQLARLEHYCPILAPSLETIETHGGGSARCMLAEIW